MKKPVEEGTWSDNVSWKLYSSDALPDEKLVTVVFCVAIHNDEIILMRAERGWGMLGGHVEGGESLLEALTREAVEEGGYTRLTQNLDTPRQALQGCRSVFL